MVYYERRLPHWQPPGGDFFLTYRLHGSIPLPILRKWRMEAAAPDPASIQTGPETIGSRIRRCQFQRRCFGQYDAYLDKAFNGPYWLSEPAVAQIVLDSLLWCHQRFGELWAACIMSNHVHILFTHARLAPPLHHIMMQHKSYTAKLCNAHLQRQGAFWQEESYDHLVRNRGEFGRILHYILMNPVKAKRVKRWEDWPWTWVHPSLR